MIDSVSLENGTDMDFAIRPVVKSLLVSDKIRDDTKE